MATPKLYELCMTEDLAPAIKHLIEHTFPGLKVNTYSNKVEDGVEVETWMIFPKEI